MKFDRFFWGSIFLPPLTCGALVAFGVGWFYGGVIEAGLIGIGFLASSTITTWLLKYSEKIAGACLRRPELRGSIPYSSGVYRNLLSESLKFLENSESEAQRAFRAKAEMEARAQVRQTQTQRLELTLNCLQTPLIVTNSQDQVQFCNPTALRLFEAGSVDEIAQNSNSPVNLYRLPQLQKLITQTRTRNAATNYRTTEFEWQQGEETILFQAVATNLWDQQGNLLGVATVLHDIREEQEQKTRHAEFVSSVCHELKTPMSSIKAYVEMLRDGDVETVEEQFETYEFIDRQVDRLTRLVNNMLNLARIESGVIEVQREDCELNGILQRSFDVVSPTAEEKKIRMVSELSELYLPAHVDQDLFGQAVINLLSNAVKYTPEGGEVRLRSRMDDSDAVIEVRDTGMGIPEESLPRLFDRFYRVPENNQAASGTGLGLALVHYIVTNIHGGRLHVESKVAEGTCFTIAVPLGHRAQKSKPKESVICAH